MQAFVSATVIALFVVVGVQPLGGAAGATATGAVSGSYPAGTTFNKVAVAGLRAGFGIEIRGDGTADGVFESTLLGTTSDGQPRNLDIQGKVTGGSSSSASTATFSGTCTVASDDGSPPSADVPFSVIMTTDGAAKGTLTLTLGATALPAATVTDGSLTLR